MKKLIGIMCACALLFTGCGTVQNNPENLAMYLADAKDIAALGTQAALMENPSFREPLTKTRDALASLEALPEGVVTVDDLLVALSNLPLDQLQSQKGKVYVTGGRIIIRRFVGWVSKPTLDVGASGALRQFAGALRQGMDEGLK